MSLSFEPKKVVSVEFIPAVHEPSSWGDFFAKFKNTYSIIKGGGEYLKIFGGALNPYVHKFPTFLANIAIVKDPVICRKAFGYYRNDKSQNGIFSSEKNSFTQFMRTVFSDISTEDVIFTCSEEKASRLHAFFVTQLSKQKVFAQTDLIQDQLESTLKKWEELRDIDLSKETKQFTSSVIGRLFLNYEGSYEELTQAVDVIFTHLGMQSKIAQLQRRILFWKHWWDPDHEARQNRLKNAVQFIRTAIEQVMENTDVDGVNLCEEMKNRKFPDGENMFSDNDIRAMILTLFLAGQDTTANLLNYILLHLAQDPELQEAVFRKEVSVENLIREGIRMFTPASLIGRYVNKDLRLEIQFEDGAKGSWFLPKDTLLTLAPTLMARDPDIIDQGDDPVSFRPSRWEDSSSYVSLQTLRWKPLGGGVHECPGKYVAEEEMKLFLSHLTGNYRLATTVQDEPKQKTNFVNRLEDPLPIQIIPR